MRLLPSRRIANDEVASDTAVNIKTVANPPSCIVTLVDHGLVHQVMRAKRLMRNNYLTTRNIKSSFLDSELNAYVPDQKILIKEMLPREQFRLFKELKPMA